MARKAARILVDIWDDREFTALRSIEQVVYFHILSSRDLSWCGVNPLLPQRMARLCSDITARKAERSLDVLAERRFLVIDQDTAEVAARTFVRHDDILASPNVSKAMCRALELVRSATIRASVMSELERLYREDSAARGWVAIGAAFPELFAELSDNPSANPSANPSRKG